MSLVEESKNHGKMQSWMSTNDIFTVFVMGRRGGPNRLALYKPPGDKDLPEPEVPERPPRPSLAPQICGFISSRSVIIDLISAI